MQKPLNFPHIGGLHTSLIHQEDSLASSVVTSQQLKIIDWKAAEKGRGFSLQMSFQNLTLLGQILPFSLPWRSLLEATP